MEKPATWVWLVCSAVATSLVAAATPAAAAETSPNFIVILTDDQGWGTTSALYDPQHPDSRSDYFQTPSIERLTQSGMRFTQAYAAHPNCAPSRAAIQTGRSPAALHFTDNSGRKVGKSARADSLYLGNKVIPPHHISDLPLGEMTIPELLKANNPSYRAAHFGKWHLEGGGPSAHGYDASNWDPSRAKAPSGEESSRRSEAGLRHDTAGNSLDERAGRWRSPVLSAGVALRNPQTLPEPCGYT